MSRVACDLRHHPSKAGIFVCLQLKSTTVENIKTSEFKVAAGTLINIGGLPVTLKEDTVIESATDLLDLSSDFMSGYEVTRAPKAAQGLIAMKGRHLGTDDLGHTATSNFNS